jgi:hypothetical protein
MDEADVALEGERRALARLVDRHHEEGEFHGGDTPARGSAASLLNVKSGRRAPPLVQFMGICGGGSSRSS